VPAHDPHGGAGASWSRRAAAIVALLAPLAMVVLAAVALAGDVAVAVLAVALVLAASAATWVALTNRGAVRAAGALAALVATGGLVAVLAAHWQGVLVLLALLLLLAAFGLGARYALGRTGAAAEQLAAQAVHADRAERGVLIINLKSGGGKAERFDLVGEARRRGIEPVVLRPGEDLLELAEAAIARGADVIGMAGGDGSQALVAMVAARRAVPHVCIPAGTRNHFALDLGLDRDDVVGALDAYTDGVERRIDLARVNDRVFVNNASLGVYAKVVQSDAYRDAKLETWARMLPDLLGPDAEPLDLEFATPQGRRYSDAPLILVSNNPYRLTSLAGAGTRARIDSGELGVVAARVIRPGDVSKLLACELAGQASRFAGLISWTAEEFEVRSSRPVEVGLDGEALVLEPPLRFLAMPGALRVRVPASAELAPGARAVALTGASVAALLRVAAGR
jgi:diacylglycerol kinase family enzyme